jgi:N-methylhydantoinase B
VSTHVDIDPITREVVQNRLISIVREMSVTLQRAAYSPIIYEVKDFSSVLLRPNGELVAQAEGIPAFLGCMHQILPPVLERYPLEEMRPLDVFVSNDPYRADGTHKNDINIVKPIFWKAEPFLFAVNKAHWTDIGGKDPGSWSPDATNTYQEGICVPALRLYEAGKLNEELMEVILSNTRLRGNNYGDLMAQVSSCHTAETRVHELLERHGGDEVNRCIDSMFDYVEAAVRAQIEQIPDGAYEAEDFVDSDGVTDEPVGVRVRITVEGSDITIDLSECDDQRAGAVGNMSLAFTTGACRVAMTCLFGPHLVKNEGFYRPIRIVTRPGSVAHPRYPAPCTPADGVIRAVMESIFFALAPVLPDRVAAGIFGGVQAMAIGGVDPRTGEPYIHFMPYAGGWGARSTKDGINGMCPAMNGDNYNIPCEVIETKFPLLVDRYELIEDSGGPGKFRGGLGVRIDYRVLSPTATVSACLARYKFAPAGLFGGGPGMRSSLILNLGRPDEADRPLVGGATVERDAVVSHRCGGGGGFGDVSERDPERVAFDIRNGYISRDAAATVYGVRQDIDELQGHGDGGR